MLFNILLDDSLELIKNSDIYNFADGSLISVASKYRDILLETLKNEGESAWFRSELVEK